MSGDSWWREWRRRRRLWRQLSRDERVLAKRMAMVVRASRWQR